MILLLAAILPVLTGSDTPPDASVKLQPPTVDMRPNEASATTSPWITANGWQILRKPGARYYYSVQGNAAALAAAEAFAYGAQAMIRATDDVGVAAFNRAVEFLRAIPDADLPVMANIGIIDDGSDDTGEVMNLLSRHNLLYKIVSSPDKGLNLNVRLGSKEYPKSEAEDPGFLAHRIRGQLGDENRLLRLYGSEVVIARLLGNRDRARVHILNYANRSVVGLRVRVLGNYSKQSVMSFGKPDLKLQDVTVDDRATEFTLPELGLYAVVDLSK